MRIFGANFTCMPACCARSACPSNAPTFLGVRMKLARLWSRCCRIMWVLPCHSCRYDTWDKNALSLAFFSLGGFFWRGEVRSYGGWNRACTDSLHFLGIVILSNSSSLPQGIFWEKTTSQVLPANHTNRRSVLGCSTTFVFQLFKGQRQQIPLGVCHFLCCFWKWWVMGRQPFLQPWFAWVPCLPPSSISGFYTSYSDFLCWRCTHCILQFTEQEKASQMTEGSNVCVCTRLYYLGFFQHPGQLKCHPPRPLQQKKTSELPFL